YIGAVNAPGLVHQQIDAFLRPFAVQFDRFAIDGDFVASRIDQNRQRRLDLAIHRDATLKNHFFDISPRRDARVGQEFLNPLFHLRCLVGFCCISCHARRHNTAEGVFAMDVGKLSDGELAGSFARWGSNELFAELIRRHSVMVFRTCRRVAGNHQDAEDAMQLVFAELAKKAATLASYRSLGGWLYSTAWHTSRHLQRSRAARRKHETHAAQSVSTGGNGHADEELIRELYRALEMLPPDYRD